MGKILQLREGAGSQGGWLDYLKECEKLPDKARYETTYYLEREKFFFTHDELAEIYLRSFQVFEPVLDSIRYYRHPYFLCKDSREKYTMACCLHLASQLIEYGKPVKVSDEPFISWRKQEWFKDLGITPAEVEVISTEVQGMGL